MSYIFIMNIEYNRHPLPMSIPVSNGVVLEKRLRRSLRKYSDKKKSPLPSLQVVWTSYGSGRHLLWQIRVWAPPPPPPVWAWEAAWGTSLRSQLNLRTWRSLQLSLRRRPTSSSSSSQPGINRGKGVKHLWPNVCGHLTNQTHMCLLNMALHIWSTFAVIITFENFWVWKQKRSRSYFFKLNFFKFLKK